VVIVYKTETVVQNRKTSTGSKVCMFPLFPTSLLNCDVSYVNVSKLHYLGTLPTNINGIHGETQKKHKPWKLLINSWYTFPKLQRWNQMK
jgi:hypothetical protein